MSAGFDSTGSGSVGPGGDPARRGWGARPGGHAPGRDGLCPVCRHVKSIVNGRGSTFLMCRLAREDASLRKYPPQPVLSCRGYED